MRKTKVQLPYLHIYDLWRNHTRIAHPKRNTGHADSSKGKKKNIYMGIYRKLIWFDFRST